MTSNSPWNLPPELVGRVPELLAAAEAEDGFRALSEQAELVLRHPRESVVHLGTWDEQGHLLAYAQVDRSVLPATVEGVVHPRHRGQGLGRTLRDVVRQVAGRGGSLVWAHGAHPAARALAAGAGAERTRELLQMRRPFVGAGARPLPPVDLPDGVRLRSFVPGQDEQRFLSVNAAAFRDHPEQGQWRRPDIEARMAEPWFDPAGFLLAEDEVTHELLGFHWTKVHPAAAGRRGSGEVYVVGVHPGAQGRRLGGALTRAGLHHLAEVTGSDGELLDDVLLYVDADNEAALRIYRELGFEVSAVDEQFALGWLPPADAIVKV